jgi:sec-independent protein translocase protein TatB
MFDVGFWELVIIALVALLVFGPEKLPTIIKELSYWFRRIQSAVSAAKLEIDHELRVLDNDNLLSEAKEMGKRKVNFKKVLSKEFNRSDLSGSENKRADTDEK